MGRKADSSWRSGWSVLRQFDGAWLVSSDLGGLEWTKDGYHSVWRREGDAQRICDDLNSGALQDPDAPERPGGKRHTYEVIPTRLDAGQAVRA
jgi:hypothetical protein